MFLEMCFSTVIFLLLVFTLPLIGVLEYSQIMLFASLPCPRKNTVACRVTEDLLNKTYKEYGRVNEG